MIEEEVLGLRENDILVSEEYVSINSNEGAMTVYLDEHGWQELYLIVKDVCVEQGIIQPGI